MLGFIRAKPNQRKSRHLESIENGFMWNGGRSAKTTIRSSIYVHLAHHLAKKHSTPETPLVFDEGNFWQYNGLYWQKLSDNVVLS